jgi:hypothetical protein
MIAYDPRRLRTLIEQYMESRAPGVSLISVAATSKALLTVMPDIPADGRELGELIALSAVKHGYAVSFDLDAADTPRTASA